MARYFVTIPMAATVELELPDGPVDHWSEKDRLEDVRVAAVRTVKVQSESDRKHAAPYASAVNVAFGQTGSVIITKVDD